MKKHRDLEDLATIIPKSIHALGRKFEHRYRCRYTLFHWRKVVGKKVFDHVKPAKIENDVLFLYAPDSTWRNELMMFQDDIVQKANNFAGEKIIKKIAFINKPNNALYNDNGEAIVINNKISKKNNLLNTLPLKEEKRIDEICRKIRDEELRTKMHRFMEKHELLKINRQKNKWHKCAACSSLCPPEHKLCLSCRQKKQAETKKKIRELLNVYPWLRYAQINNIVPCTPDDINDVRLSMVQKMASSLVIDDTKGDVAKKLVMLYLCLPPEELNDDIINKTFYRLRNDFAKKEKFTPIKRKNFIKRK